MSTHRPSAPLSSWAATALLCVACSRGADLDLRVPFESLNTGDSLELVRTKLARPLNTPHSHEEAFGFRYTEYRLIDQYSSYRLRFCAAPGTQPVLLIKSSTANVR